MSSLALAALYLSQIQCLSPIHFPLSKKNAIDLVCKSEDNPQNLMFEPSKNEDFFYAERKHVFLMQKVLTYKEHENQCAVVDQDDELIFKTESDEATSSKCVEEMWMEMTVDSFKGLGGRARAKKPGDSVEDRLWTGWFSKCRGESRGDQTNRGGIPICPSGFKHKKLSPVFSSRVSVAYKEKKDRIFRKDLFMNNIDTLELHHLISQSYDIVPRIYCIQINPKDHAFYALDPVKDGLSDYVFRDDDLVTWPLEWNPNQTQFTPISLYMEYMRYGDLVGCINTWHVPMNTDEKLLRRQWLAEAYVIIDLLHKMGIIHLDIKPDNFLVASDGHLRITDFEIARWDETRQQDNTPDGTPLYRPSKYRIVDETLDYYAYGVILYSFYERDNSFADESDGVFGKARFSELTPEKIREAVIALTHPKAEIRRLYWQQMREGHSLFDYIDWDAIEARFRRRKAQSK